MRLRTKLLLAASAALPLAAAAQAATVDPALFQDLQWRSVGPFRGGRVLAVAGDPDGSRSVSTSERSTAASGGPTMPAARGSRSSISVNVGSIGAIAVAPSAPKTSSMSAPAKPTCAPTSRRASACSARTTAARAGSRSAFPTRSRSRKILVDPRNPNVVLVAALGHPYGPNAERGVFRSTDGGRHWTKTLYKDADTGAIDLAFEPGNPNVVYAALWQTRRPPWNTYPPSNGPGSGLYKSTDGGRTWHQLTGHGLAGAPGADRPCDQPREAASRLRA